MSHSGPPPCTLCSASHWTAKDIGVTDLEYGTPGSYDYWQCGSCGLVQIYPLVSGEVLARAYPLNYHAYQGSGSRLGRWLKRRYWRGKAQRYRQLLPRDGAVLDIGCANGDFLGELQNLGVKNLVGIDFSAAAVARAQARGLDARVGEVETLGLPEQTFDLIVMTNFIEHVSDPVRCLVHCSRLLRPGGSIIGETPNIASWDYRLFRRHWGGYHAPRHLFLFDPHTLVLLARKAGLIPMGVTNMLQPAHWALSLQNRLADSPIGLPLTGGRSRFYTLFQLLSAPINVAQLYASATTSVEFSFRKG